MTPEELVRTQAARQELSPRRTIRHALDSMDSAKDAIVSAFIYSYSGTSVDEAPVTRATLEFAARQARLAADLLQELAERVK